MNCKYILLLSLLLFSGCQTTDTTKAPVSLSGDRAKIESIFAILDTQMQGSDEYIRYLEEDVILMAHNIPVINGQQDYIEHIQESRSYGTTNIQHQLLEAYSYEDHVIARGKAIGTFHANGSDKRIAFETKNVFVFRRLDTGELKIWQTIFNMNP